MFNQIKQTISFCPECYKHIPAKVGIEDNLVVMQKTCSVHGSFTSVLESNPAYYLQCLQAGATNIYNGYFLDVTSRCNLNCRYCYYGVDKKSTDPTIDDLYQEAQLCAGMAPIIITGGEPTLRKDLVSVIAALKQVTPQIELLTNGSGLTEELLSTIGPPLLKGNVISINLSMHPESNGADYKVIDLVRTMGLKLESVLCVIDSLNDIDQIVKFSQENSDVIEAVRIKAATKLWAESKPENKIFVSDMLNYMQLKYPVQPLWWRNNKTSFFNLSIGNVYYMLVSWYDVTNVDILDIKCPPFYRAKNGQIENIVTAAIINEGMSKGWLAGRKISNG